MACGIRLVVVLLLVIGLGCSRGSASMDESQQTEIMRVVEERMHAFEAAERALDAEQLLSHFAPGPEFSLHNDGQRLGYDEVAAGVRGAFPTLRSIAGGFEDLRIIVLAPDAALATATFRETVTDGRGNQARRRGAATWLWRLIGEEWRIAYGHVDHYPDAQQ